MGKEATKYFKFMLRGGAPLYLVRKVCYMTTENTLMKFGFVKEEDNSQLKELLKGSVKLKEVHIDTYTENPVASSSSFMLLLRASEKNATVLIDKNRLIFKRNDSQNTYFMNILLDKIIECFSKVADGYSEYILNVQNIYYRITVLN